MKVITIIGRLTKDCEVRQGKKGEFATFSVAVKDGYGQNERAIYFDIMYWNANLKPSLVKGKEVAVTGEFSTNEYKEKTYLKINANEVKLLGKKPENNRYAEGDKIDEETTEETSNQTPSQDFDDEIPF
tara:strand:+ start:386 stop:772 length:387 start_codon:yes stop_codon:yes gene_type:complete